MSDLLTQALEAGGLARDDLRATLLKWLGSDLVEDQYARMAQAGRGIEEGVHLARVFIDLRASERAYTEREGIDEATERRETLAFAAAMLAEDAPPAKGRVAAQLRRGAHLLVGGPGQGKSTIGQFLAQVHRAALLSAHDDALANDERMAMEALRTYCKADGVAPPARALFPVRVELRELAAWLADRDPNTVGFVDYLVHDIQRVTKLSAVPGDLDLVLQRVPILLILDGLDEVPPVAGRDVVMRVVEFFLHSRREAADLVLASTRPQGYGKEFEHFRTWHLAPLSKTTALGYARRLIDAWLLGQPREQQKTLARMERATAEDTTAGLLHSPLQVTIVTLLVSRTGSTPRSRWELFDSYFTTIYMREEERRTYASELLSEHRAVIHAVHDHAGLLLQTEGETAANAGALLPRERLEEVIVYHLRERGHADIRSRMLAQEILQAAAQRLVLLTEARPGRYGFEVRSLQEFMAARQLTSGDAGEVFERLCAVARSLYWRNVVRFAVGRYFAGNISQAVRHQMSAQLCARVTDDHAHEREFDSYPGAELARDLLDDSAVTTDLRCVRSLVVQTLPLLDRGWHNDQASRLGQVLVNRLEDLEVEDLSLVLASIRNALERAVVGEPWTKVWFCAAVIASSSDGAAIRGVLDEAWARLDANVRARMLRSWLIGYSGKDAVWAFEHFDREFEEYPMDLFSFGFSLNRSALGVRARTAVDFIESVKKSRPIDLRVTPADSEVVGGVVPGCSITRAGRYLDPPFEHGTWSPFRVARPFFETPCATTLAECLRTLAAIQIDPFLRSEPFLPWPLVASLRFATTPEALLALAERVDAGDLGDIQHWLAAEERWINDGFVLDDLLHVPADGLPFDPSPGSRALPGSAQAYPRGQVSVPDADLEAIVQGVRRARTDVRERVCEFVRCVLTWASESERPHSFSVDTLELLSDAFVEGVDLGLVLVSLPDPTNMSAQIVERFDALFRRMRVSMLAGIRFDPASVVRRWAPLWIEDRHRVGILRLLGWLGMWRGTTEMLRGKVDYAWYESARDRWSALSVQLALGALDTYAPEQLAKDLCEIAMGESEADVRLLLYRENDVLAQLPALVEALWRRRDMLPQRWRDDLCYWQRMQFGRCSTSLHTPTRWAALSLPFPGPLASSTQAEARPWSEVVVLSSLDVRSIRAFDHLPMALKGQWTVLVGENGVGKTTVLRALALCLATPDTATALARQCHAPHRRHGVPRGLVEVTFNGLRFGVTLNGDPGQEIVRADEFTRSLPNEARPWVVGYGCRRGSALGGAKRDVTFGEHEQFDSLFDGSRGLVHADTWLAEQKLAATLAPEGPAAKRYEAIVGVLRDVLHVDKIDIEIDPRDMRPRVWVESAATGRATLSGLSDGYVTTAGWVIDLIARWVDRCSRLREKLGDRFDERDVLGARFHEHMTGLVLLDEIDLHLHPQWQMRVISTVRDAFPKLSFVVTTHNPLTLLAAREGEVWVFRRPDGTGAIHPLQLDLPKGVRIEHILTGAWFELDSTFDPDTREKLAAHRAMLREGVAPDHPGRLELEAILRARLVSVGDTWIERLGIEAANQALAERQLPLTDADTEDFQRWVAETVARRAPGPA